MTKSTSKSLQLKISLAEIKPEIWRRIILAPDTSLHGLHRIIQLLYEWYDYHLYEFTIRGIKYQQPGPESEGRDSTRARLSQFHFAVGDEFTYVYDFGDCWIHRVRVEAYVQNADPGWLPHLVAGERRGPPEDCGGPGGFERFLEAIANPKDNEYDEYRTWVGDDYSPDNFDLRTLRHALLLSAAWLGDQDEV